MSLFDFRKLFAAATGEHLCAKCGALMEYEDDSEDVLVCPKCGHSVFTSKFAEDDEEDSYESVYNQPYDGEFDGPYTRDEDDYGEYYDPEYDE